MSTVLWANCLVEGEVRSDQEDRAALYRHAKKLDALSRSLRLPSFLAACDQTDQRYNLQDLELPAGMSSTNDVMVADGAWLTRADALAMLEGLHAHIREAKPRFGLLGNQHADVVDELAGVIAFVRSQPAAEKFNFAVVM
ncbi:hypothetical protein [Lysobacter arvi]|uniref:Uncharacterized protein n=1 Tax=Lysobacter arvi TaxID=3038776 RepID=A0ABU1CCY2_9GAMM|nr:hypothetical protein [Lysobacter arvi]MDR0182980.1 hypothetical protein [Lysobacter arvi]